MLNKFKQTIEFSRVVTFFSLARTDSTFSIFTFPLRFFCHFLQSWSLTVIYHMKYAFILFEEIRSKADIFSTRHIIPSIQSSLNSPSRRIKVTVMKFTCTNRIYGKQYQNPTTQFFNIITLPCVWSIRPFVFKIIQMQLFIN